MLRVGPHCAGGRVWLTKAPDYPEARNMKRCTLLFVLGFATLGSNAQTTSKSWLVFTGMTNNVYHFTVGKIRIDARCDEAYGNTLDGIRLPVNCGNILTEPGEMCPRLIFHQQGIGYTMTGSSVSLWW